MPNENKTPTRILLTYSESIIKDNAKKAIRDAFSEYLVWQALSCFRLGQPNTEVGTQETFLDWAKDELGELYE
jgi:hypothetical protein